MYISQRIVLGPCQCGAVAYFRPQDDICSRCDVSRLRAPKLRAEFSEHYLLMRTSSEGRMNCLSCDPSCVETKLSSSKGRSASLDGNDLCRECDGTGWVLYHSETTDGEFEEAYRLCPKGHAPRYCMGSSSAHLCSRPATERCGLGYYCKEHIVVTHDGRDVDDPCEAI
jgi:hypothetical protein